jgi:hypothetical protein
VIIGQSGCSATGSVEREILNSGSGGRDFLDSSSPMALSNRRLRFVFYMNGYREVDMTMMCYHGSVVVAMGDVMLLACAFPKNDMAIRHFRSFLPRILT